MTKPRNKNPNIQDQLANYTDALLAGKAVHQNEATFAPDSESRTLEETVLRLNTAFSDDDPDETTIQRMHKRIIEGWQQERQTISQSLWQRWAAGLQLSRGKWRSQHSRQRLSMALSLVALVLLMLIGIPFTDISGSNQPGASGQNVNVIVLVIFGSLVLVAIWLNRRKP